MVLRYSLLALGVVASAVLLPTSPARADAIDGNWCHAEAGRMSIRGPDIVTPGGTRMQGNYGRHSFSYDVPAAEPGAGATLFMLLIDDETVHLTIGENTANSAPQIWHRCAADVS